MRISKQAERRFVLGLQGLWPGRRWKGRDGIREALTACRGVQVDPLDVVGHNEDLVFASRVEGYRPTDLEVQLYGDRIGYEFGGTISIFPKEALRLHVSWVANEGLPLRWERWFHQHRGVVDRVLKRIEERGPQASTDFSGGTRVRDYRSGTLEGLALYVLWRRLDVLIHHRAAGRKYYERTEKMYGPRPEAWSKEETLGSMALETLSRLGLSGDSEISYLRTQEDGRGRSKISKREIRQMLVDDGRLREVMVEGDSKTSVVRTEQLPLLEAVAAGDVPREWKPLQTSPEAVFLGPLDTVSARGRSKTLFDFEYLWEVYKPASKRRWGYYILPVLLDDRLIGRIEPVRDNRTGALRLVHAWWERGTDLEEAADPVARCIRRFAEFLGTEVVVLGNIGSTAFRKALTRRL